MNNTSHMHPWYHRKVTKRRRDPVAGIIHRRIGSVLAILALGLFHCTWKEVLHGIPMAITTIKNGSSAIPILDRSVSMEGIPVKANQLGPRCRHTRSSIPGPATPSSHNSISITVHQSCRKRWKEDPLKKKRCGLLTMMWQIPVQFHANSRIQMPWVSPLLPSLLPIDFTRPMDILSNIHSNKTIFLLII